MSGHLAMILAAVDHIIDLVVISASDTSASVASAVGSLELDGDISKTESVTTTDLGDWISPKALASAYGADYECQLTGTGDTPTGPALTSWHTLDTTRSWSLVQSGTGSKSFSGTLKIRKGSTVLKSESFSLTATVI